MAQQKPIPLQTLWMIWGAILTTPIVLGVLGTFVLPAPQQPIQPMLLWILAGLGFAMSIAAQVGPVALISALEPSMVFVLRWALLESIAVFGLVARMMGATTDQLAAFVVGSLFLLILNRPKQETLDGLALMKANQAQSNTTGA